MNCDYKDRWYLLRYYFLSLAFPFLRRKIIEYFYKKELGKKLNLSRPESLTEKIQYLKLYSYKNGLELADKLKAKEYVKKEVPELDFAKVYCVADKFEQLDFEKCPKSFIIKTNHSWKTNTVILDKNSMSEKNLKEYAEYYNSALKIKYEYWAFFELQYRNIERKVFVEEFVGNPNPEYEVYCFNGKVQFVKINTSLIDKYGYSVFDSHIYSREKEKLDFNIFFKSSNECNIDFRNFEKIVSCSEKLSRNFDFVRIDFMEVDGKLYFLEFTFSPHSGFIKFIPEKYDLIYGKKLIIK